MRAIPPNSMSFSHLQIPVISHSFQTSLRFIEHHIFLPSQHKSCHLSNMCECERVCVWIEECVWKYVSERKEGYTMCEPNCWKTLQIIHGLNHGISGFTGIHSISCDIDSFYHNLNSVTLSEHLLSQQ